MSLFIVLSNTKNYETNQLFLQETLKVETDTLIDSTGVYVPTEKPEPTPPEIYLT